MRKRKVAESVVLPDNVYRYPSMRWHILGEVAIPRIRFAYSGRLTLIAGSSAVARNRGAKINPIKNEKKKSN